MLHRFDYTAPRDRAELLDVLAARGQSAMLLAGGTDVLVNIRGGAARPELLIDVKRVPGWGEITWSDADGLVIRAGDNHQRPAARPGRAREVSAAGRVRARPRLLPDPQSRDGRRQRRQRVAVRRHGAGAVVPRGARGDRRRSAASAKSRSAPSSTASSGPASRPTRWSSASSSPPRRRAGAAAITSSSGSTATISASSASRCASKRPAIALDRRLARPDPGADRRTRRFARPPTRWSLRSWRRHQPDQRRAGTKEYRLHMVESFVRRLLDEVRS